MVDQRLSGGTKGAADNEEIAENLSLIFCTNKSNLSSYDSSARVSQKAVNTATLSRKCLISQVRRSSSY